MSGKLRLYKDKLEGYKKFYSIVKTIKMVTLAKYRQSLGRVKTRDMTLRYSERSFTFPHDEEAAIAKATKPLLYIPVTTNRGSCGALNSNVFRYLDENLSKHMKIMPIGKKGNDSLSKLFPKEYTYTLMNDMKTAQSFAWASFVLENANTIEYERLQLVFSRFVSAGIQRQFTYNIPEFDTWKAKLEEQSGEPGSDNSSFANAVLENDDVVVRDFYDFHASLMILNAVSENELAEYAARIVAVEGQLTNISQLQSHTQYLYNKTRQSSITAALIEILSAMSAMDENSGKGAVKGHFWDSAVKA